MGQGRRGEMRGQTHCSTLSREPQPQRSRRAAGNGAQTPAPRQPPPCRACGGREGEPRPPRPAPPRPGSIARLGRPKMAAAAALTREGGEDAFRRLFRFYRQRDVSDLRGVVDFSAPGGQVFRSQLSISSVSDQDAYRAGLQPVSQWKAYGLNGYPGFIFIPNPFLPGCQRHWVKQCLKLYPQKPNVCNLDLHMAPEKTIDLWGQSKEQLRRKGSSKREPRSLLEKLRWVTLGYHYNWDTKKYSANHHTPFPSDLAFLSEQVAAACGFRGFQAQAGILNYYHFDSSLGIHVDESELDHSRPLLSFSFGQSSIFLLGGRKREEAPTAMFMHSGDIMVMSGLSRLLYHAVPRVLPNPEGTAVPSCLDQALPSDLPVGSVIEHSSDEDWQVKMIRKQLEERRIPDEQA
ncbi:nucleic acid dioxygenase ALKBH1 isoform X2 [Pipra filicauda]|uniref:Nucleic acid dioxygenase ALKBH1 n=1 Tax=Pipra filicauda TaxID=649802 RepID=A0A7R5KWZ7_9PASS|nr:nucleic acid dioxygenase ALKBH1 isoform X2 [Pipra filicauda]